MQLVRVLYRPQGFHGLVTGFTNHCNPISRDSQLNKFLVSIPVSDVYEMFSCVSSFIALRIVSELQV